MQGRRRIAYASNDAQEEVDRLDPEERGMKSTIELENEIKDYLALIRRNRREIKRRLEQ
jgi:hypothetical protein